MSSLLNVNTSEDLEKLLKNGRDHGR
jgi:hypothetical protein